MMPSLRPSYYRHIMQLIGSSLLPLLPSDYVRGVSTKGQERWLQKEVLFYSMHDS